MNVLLDETLSRFIADAASTRKHYGKSESAVRRAKARALKMYKEWIKHPTSIPYEAAKKMLLAENGDIYLRRLNLFQPVVSIVIQKRPDSTSLGILSAETSESELLEEDGSEVVATSPDVVGTSISNTILAPYDEDVHSNKDSGSVDEIQHSFSSEDVEDDVDIPGAFPDDLDVGLVPYDDEFFAGPSDSTMDADCLNSDGSKSCRGGRFYKNGRLVKLKQLSFVQILQHCTAKFNHSMASMTEFLQMLHHFKPEMIYDDLPKTGRKLMKLSKDESYSYLQRDLSTYDSEKKSFPDNNWVLDIDPDSVDAEVEDAEELFRVRPCNLPPVRQNLPHLFMYFGIERNLLADCPGMIHQHSYKNIMKLVDGIDPDMFTPAFKRMIARAEEMSKYGSLLTMEVQAMQAKIAAETKKKKLPHFRIDVNIDGSQFFENSAAPQGYPILGRIHSIGKHRVPVRQSPVFLIGIYHGPGGMNYDAFLHDFVSELKHLHPKNKNAVKCVRVTLRLMICDGGIRYKLKGIISTQGYWSCEKCTTPGKKVGTGAIHFPDTDCPHRTMIDWESYRKKAVYHDGVLLPKGHPLYLKRHVIADELTRMEEIPDFDMITGFSSDPMHTIDGGVIIYLFLYLFGLGKRDSPNSLPHGAFETANRFIDAWMKCTPEEVQRRPRSLKHIQKWKMIESRNFLMYLATAVFVTIGDLSPASHFFAVKDLVKGLRLMSGTSLEPVQNDVLEESRFHLTRYFVTMIALFGEPWAVYKNHLMLHTPDECHYHGCHMDALAGYAFENQQSFYPKLLKSGKSVLRQIANGLARHRKYVIAEWREEGLADPFQETLKKVKANGNKLALPTLSLKWIERTKFMDKAVCEGFLITSRFPNNVVKFEDGAEKESIGIVVSINVDEKGYEYFSIRKFQNVRNVYETPFKSSEVGIYRVQELATRGVEIVCGLRDIKGKFYALHEDLQKPHAPEHAPQNQSWIVTLLRHSECPP